MICLKAPAKINLCLNIAEPNPHKGPFYGYHALESLVVFAENAFDEVQIEPSSEIELQIDGPFAQDLGNCQENLMMRAALIMREKYRVLDGAKISLNKNLPIASGIGGGSSDCAAAIIGLNRLWNLNLSRSELFEIGQIIGSDVPACIAQEPLVMSEYGAKFVSAPKIPDLPALLINPLISAPTPMIYKQYDKLGQFPKSLDISYTDCDNVFECTNQISMMRNDLEAAAISIVPQIAELLAFLESQKGRLVSRMSGSGATCFALFDDIANAHIAQINAQKEFGTGKIWAKATVLKGNIA